LARIVFLRRIVVDSRRSSLSDSGGVALTGCETEGRVGNVRLGETGDCVAALEPGAFLLPGFMRYDSPSDVPNARPAAAMPTVPTAHS
jgi:hypothetical protein